MAVKLWLPGSKLSENIAARKANLRHPVGPRKASKPRGVGTRHASPNAGMRPSRPSSIRRTLRQSQTKSMSILATFDVDIITSRSGDVCSRSPSYACPLDNDTQVLCCLCCLFLSFLAVIRSSSCRLLLLLVLFLHVLGSR